MSKIKAIGLGAGGHCKVLMEILREQGDVDVVGLLDLDVEQSNFNGVPILGNDDWIVNAPSIGITHFFVGVGSVRATLKRKNLFELGIHAGLIPLDVIHPHVVIAKSVTLGIGIQIMCGTMVDSEAFIGDNCLLNIGSIIGHETIIGNHSHVSSTAVVSGGCQVGENCLIGVGSIVSNNINIGNMVTVGAGALVIRNVPDNLTVVGVPAKPLVKKS